MSTLPIGNQTVRTQYTGMSTPVDTICEPDDTQATVKARHLANVTDRWRTEPPVVDTQPHAFVTLEYVSGGEMVGTEMDQNPGEALLHYERRFLNTVAPAFFDSHPVDLG